MRQVFAAALLALLPLAAFANPCGFQEAGRLVVKGYPVGGTAIPASEKERLARFAETACHRFGICVFAQVDEQGTEAANERVATTRAAAVHDFLIARGVKRDTIRIALQEDAVTFFGLLPSDQADDRRVVATHD